MIEHLVVSTIVLALVMLAARVLPVTARTRHAMLLCGIAKFAVPSAVFGMMGVKAIEVLPAPPRVFLAASAAAPAAQKPVNWLLIAWAAVATLIFARWLLLRTRTIAAALRSSVPPSPRELDALAAARRLLGIRTAVDLLRSPVCEAPAVLRVVRPVVVLPARGCDDLSDDELHALLLHELAHVARRDNLVSAFTALAASLLCFHPLVWLALRRIDGAREQACDERVAEVMNHAETYLDALTKVCRAILTTRTAGASCMAGANVKERMEHLMQYETLRKRAWSHRGVVAMALVAVVAATAFATETRFVNQDLYSLRFDITPAERQVTFVVEIIERASGDVVAKPRVTAELAQWATVTADHAGRRIEVRMRMDARREAELFITVKDGETLVQRNLYTWQPSPAPAVTPSQPEFSGAPITMQLKNADIRDVMRTFAEITGMTIEVAPEVAGTVTLDATDMPWDEAMVKCVQQVGGNIHIEGKTVRITK